MAYESESELIQTELEDEYSGELEDEIEGEYEDESSLEGEGWLGAIGNVVGSLLGEGEGEDEYEDEYEDESAFESEAEEEISPIRKIYPDAMMEHLGQLAAEAETEDEAAEHFLPLIGMAASKLLPVVAKAVLPNVAKVGKRALRSIGAPINPLAMAKSLQAAKVAKAARAVTRSTPRLTRGVGTVARGLYRNPQTRHLLKTVPAIARRTVGSIARQAVHGRHITPRTAVRTLARQTRHVLGHPQRRKHALRHHNHLERRFHRGYGRGMARPHWQWRHGRRWYGRGPAPGYAAPRAGTPGYVVPGAGIPATGVQPVRYGQVVGGQCTCAPCPACGGKPGASTPVPTPAYCRCCGQVLR
jgi:hypothetical protein